MNECIPKDRRGCKYASFRNFMLAIDILRSSGTDVDIVQDDFK